MSPLPNSPGSWEIQRNATNIPGRGGSTQATDAYKRELAVAVVSAVRVTWLVALQLPVPHWRILLSLTGLALAQSAQKAALCSFLVTRADPKCPDGHEQKVPRLAAAAFNTT